MGHDELQTTVKKTRPFDTLILINLRGEFEACDVVKKACFNAVDTVQHDAWCWAFVSCKNAVEKTVWQIRDMGGLLLIGTNFIGLSS